MKKYVMMALVIGVLPCNADESFASSPMAMAAQAEAIKSLEDRIAKLESELASRDRVREKRKARWTSMSPEQRSALMTRSRGKRGGKSSTRIVH